MYKIYNTCISKLSTQVQVSLSKRKSRILEAGQKYLRFTNHSTDILQVNDRMAIFETFFCVEVLRPS